MFLVILTVICWHHCVKEEKRNELYVEKYYDLRYKT